MRLRSAEQNKKTKSKKSPKAIYNFSAEYFLGMIAAIPTSAERYKYCIEQLESMESVENVKFLHSVLSLFEAPERNKYLFFFPGTERIAKHLSKMSDLTEIIKLLHIDSREAFCSVCIKYNEHHNIVTGIFLASLVNLVILLPEDKQLSWAKDNFHLSNYCYADADDITTAITQIPPNNQYSFLQALLGKDRDDIIIRTKALNKYLNVLSNQEAINLFYSFNTNFFVAYYRQLNYVAMRDSITAINQILPGTSILLVEALPESYFERVFRIPPDEGGIGECDPILDDDKFCDWLSYLGEEAAWEFCKRFNKTFFYYLIDRDIVKTLNLLLIFPEAKRLEFCQNFIGNHTIRKVASNIANFAELMHFFGLEGIENPHPIEVAIRAVQFCNFLGGQHINKLLKTQNALEELLGGLPHAYKDCYRNVFIFKAVHADLNRFFKQRKVAEAKEEKTPPLAQERLRIHSD
jgi:hypothetical protein